MLGAHSIVKTKRGSVLFPDFEADRCRLKLGRTRRDGFNERSTHPESAMAIRNGQIGEPKRPLSHVRIISARIARIAHDLVRNLRHEALAPGVAGKAGRNQGRRVVSGSGSQTWSASSRASAAMGTASPACARLMDTCRALADIAPPCLSLATRRDWRSGGQAAAFLRQSLREPQSLEYTPIIRGSNPFSFTEP